MWWNTCIKPTFISIFSLNTDLFDILHKRQCNCLLTKTPTCQQKLLSLVRDKAKQNLCVIFVLWIKPGNVVTYTCNITILSQCPPFFPQRFQLWNKINMNRLVNSKRLFKKLNVFAFLSSGHLKGFSYYRRVVQFVVFNHLLTTKVWGMENHKYLNVL